MEQGSAKAAGQGRGKAELTTSEGTRAELKVFAQGFGAAGWCQTKVTWRGTSLGAAWSLWLEDKRGMLDCGF